MFMKKKSMKKETTKKENITSVHTQEEQEKFVGSIEKQLKKFFNTKEDLTSVVVLAGNETKNIAIGAGDLDKAIALMYDMTKKLGNDYVATLCGMLLRELTQKEINALVKTLVTVSSLSEGKKVTLN